MLNLDGCREEVHVMPRLRHVEHGRAPSHCHLSYLMSLSGG
jgi:hypothetical protein